ncbi:unnamed protein product, partial [Mesorhabditis spiculigera]
MLVFDVTSRESFEHIQGWLNEAQNNVGGPCPGQSVFQLVGHKADREQERQVLHEEGEYFAKYHKMKYIETSAITGENVNDAFLMMAHEVHARLESGYLRIQDGWEGIKSGMMGTRSIYLSEEDLRDDTPSNSCSC